MQDREFTRLLEEARAQAERALATVKAAREAVQSPPPQRLVIRPSRPQAS